MPALNPGLSFTSHTTRNNSLWLYLLDYKTEVLVPISDSCSAMNMCK